MKMKKQKKTSVDAREQPLGTVAAISMGCVTARKKASEKTGHHYPVLTLKYFAEHQTLKAGDLEEMYFTEAFDRSAADGFLSRRGDVVVRLNHPYGARFVSAEGEGMLIPSAFAIVRMKSNRLNAEFLTCCLNAPETLENKMFQKSSFGALPKPITVRELLQLKLLIPTLDKQNRIVGLWAEVEEEQRLLKELAKKKLALARLKMKRIIAEEAS